KNQRSRERRGKSCALPCCASPCPAARAAGNPAPRRAAHVAKIGLAGLPGAVTLRGSPRPRLAAQALAPLPALRVTPRPRLAAHVAKIGLTGFPAALTPQESPHPPVPLTLLFSLLALAGVAVQLTCRDNFAAFFLTTSRFIVV